jgi:xylulokinase
MHVDRMGRLHSFNHAQPNSWYLMGVMLAAGLSFRWFRRCLGGMEESISEQMDSDPYDLLTKEAETAPPGSGKLIFLPYLGGERTPHADPDARGVFFGLTDSHKKGHLVRAVLEGISFGLRDSLELIKEKEIEPREIRITGGGASSDLWTQIQADIFGYKIKKTSINEGPAFGAALLAGVGADIYRDVNQATSETVEARIVAEPRRDKERIYNELYGVYRSLYGSLKGDFKSLAGIEEPSK